MFNLKTVEIENFRSFEQKTKIHIDQLTTIIGKNDAGKSTILEALEIFFNNDIVKIDKNDANVFTKNDIITITCTFDNVDYPLTLDETAITYLKNEYLLNKENNLEIIKKYDTSKSNIKPDIYVRASYFKDQEDHLINLTQANLKKIIKENNIKDEGVKYNSNVSMREAIHTYYLDDKSILEDTIVHLSKQDGKKLWTALSKKLPVFALFKADRPSNDEDSEVQDPMKLAIKQALIDVEDKLEEIKNTVRQEAIKTANNTIEKLKEMDPRLANELIPEFKDEPKWERLFKLSLESEQGIPVNKRGSGVRRLILLNFFRAEVEKERHLQDRGVIYAIEEPETAQHPNNQKLLIESLQELAINNCQILITTHVPGVAELLPTKSIRYITESSKLNGNISTPTNKELDIIANNLGVLPSSRVKMLLYVEGKNDVIFLKHISNLLETNGITNLNLFKDNRVAIIPTGGVNSLKDFINKKYLKTLNIPELYIIDKDENNVVPGAIVTKRREMENYIHPNAIKQYFNDKYPALVNTTYEIAFEDPNLNLPVALHQHLKSHATKLKPHHPPKVDTIKNWLNSNVIKLMTLEDLKEIGSIKGESAFDEINSWFKRMEEKLNSKQLIDT